MPLREVSSIIEGFEPLQHRYIEFAADEGTDVLASFDGIVISSDHIDGKGYYLMIEQEGVIRIMYSHMKSICVALGDTVKQGDVIGQVGATGDERESSLEFRVFDWNNGQCDPILFLPDNILVETG